MPDVVHVCYPGIGGEAAVATGLAEEGHTDGVSQGIIFYGTEPVAPRYVKFCNEAGIEFRSIEKKQGMGLSAPKQLSDALHELAPQVVIAHHHSTAITAALSGLRQFKVIFVEHHSNALKTKRDWLLSTLAHQLTAHTVFLTKTYCDAVHAKIGRFLRKQKTSVIPNGLNLTHYTPAESQTKQSEEPFVIGMQGRMDEGKDYSTLLHAFAEVSKEHNVVLELAGDGPSRNKFEQLANELGVSDHVIFHGFLSSSQLIESMQRWDLAVLATVGETLSIAILEAWATRLPLIGTRVAGVSDLIREDVDGLLVELFDTSDMVAAMKRLIDNPPLRMELANEGRERVERSFTRKGSSAQYLKLAGNFTHKFTKNTLNYT